MGDLMKLGVFDSGLGGLTVLKQILDAKDVDVIYLADQKNIPYGTKSREELIELMTSNINWFVKQGVDTLLFACNTVSTIVDELRIIFPSIRLISIIEEYVKQLVEYDDMCVLLLATQATIRSNKYIEELSKYDHSLKVEKKALVNLVDLIESSANDEEIVNYLESELSEYHDNGCNYVLACTHYPLVEDKIKQILGESNIKYYDPLKSIDVDKMQSGELKVYTTKEADIFKMYVDRIIGKNTVVVKVEL